MKTLKFPKFASKVEEAGVNRFNANEVAQVMEEYLTPERSKILLLMHRTAPTEADFHAIIVAFGNGYAPFPAEGEFACLNSVFDEIEAACN